MNTLSELNDDVLVQVFLALRISDLGCAACVCGSWAQANRRDGLWRRLCVRDSPSVSTEEPAREQDGWRSTYRANCVLRFGSCARPEGGDDSGLRRPVFMVVGEQGCGKSEFLARFEGQPYVAYRQPGRVSTPDYKARYVTLDGRGMRIVLWELPSPAGPERRPRIQVAPFLRRANGILLCFSVRDRVSFEFTQDWLVRHIGPSAPSSTRVMLVGCKADGVRGRAVTQAEGCAHAAALSAAWVGDNSPTARERKRLGTDVILYRECSALRGTGVEETLVKLARCAPAPIAQPRNSAQTVPKFSPAPKENWEKRPSCSIQ